VGDDLLDRCATLGGTYCRSVSERIVPRAFAHLRFDHLQPTAALEEGQEYGEAPAEEPEGTTDTPNTGTVPQEGSERRSWLHRFFFGE